MQYAKFLLKYTNDMLSNYFDSYFTSLDSIHHHYTRQKSEKDIFLTYSRTKWKKQMSERKA